MYRGERLSKLRLTLLNIVTNFGTLCTESG